MLKLPYQRMSYTFHLFNWISPFKGKTSGYLISSKITQGHCQLRVKPPCYKKMKQTENVFLMLMMNNERVVQLMTNLDSHGKVINSVSHCHCSQNGWKQEKSHVNSFFSNDWTNFLSSKNVHLKCVCIHLLFWCCFEKYQ